MANKGYEAEERVVRLLEKAGKRYNFTRLDGSCQTIQIDRILTCGKTTRSKADIILNSQTRLQVKSRASNRAAIVNMARIDKLENLGRREMLDVAPIFQAIENFRTMGRSTARLSELSDKEEWREFLLYFLFEGTTMSQTHPNFQATHLLDVDGDNWLLIQKNEAVDYLWNKLHIEIRHRGKNANACLHVRVGK